MTSKSEDAAKDVSLADLLLRGARENAQNVRGENNQYARGSLSVSFRSNAFKASPSHPSEEVLCSAK